MSNLAILYLPIHKNEVDYRGVWSGQSCDLQSSESLLLQHDPIWDSESHLFQRGKVQLVYNHMPHHHMPLIWIEALDHKWRKRTSHWSTSRVRIYIFPYASFAPIGWQFCFTSALCSNNWLSHKHLGLQAPKPAYRPKGLPLSNQVACGDNEISFLMRIATVTA